MFFSFVIYPLTQIIEFVFSFCNKIFSNTGVSIIGVSCAVSLLTLPLYIVAENWMQVERNIQKKMKPKVDKIKTVFKGNEQYMILSTYYRQMHYHPIMSLRSAFGLLIQIPFFTAAYTCLSNMTALQGESFLFIKDMGTPDALFSIGNFNVNVLPIAMTLINMISGTIYTKGLSIRDKLQTYGLALVFVVLLYNSPAGLVMYWTMNNIFSLVKNIFYKLKNPIKTLYFIACSLVTIFIIWLFAGHILSTKRALLVSIVFSVVYFVPFIVKFCNHISNNSLKVLSENKKASIILFELSTIGLSILCGIAISSNLISINTLEFCGIQNYANPTYFIKNTLFQSLGFFIIWSNLIFFLFINNKSIRTLFSFLLPTLFTISIVNNFVFSGSYGIISTSLVFTTVSSVDSEIGISSFNLLLDLVIALVIFIILKLNKTKILNSVLLVINLSLFLYSLLNYIKIEKDFSNFENLKSSNIEQKSLEPIFHFSKTGNNVLMIFLDRAQSRYLEEAFKECPELYTNYEGFVYYKNTLSYNGHTLMGAPACFGGYEYTPEEINNRDNIKLIDKQNEALTLLPRIFTEQGDDFSATVTDSPWANYSWIPDLSIFNSYNKINAFLTDSRYKDYWLNKNKEFQSIVCNDKILLRNLLWFSFFKISPLFLRPAFYNDGNYWSANNYNEDFSDFLNGYSVLDVLTKITDFDSKTKNSFICFVNNTTHENYPLQAPDFIPKIDVTNKGTSKYASNPDYAINVGSLKRIGEWLEYLKKNDCYDNTRIVIVADHGEEHSNDQFFSTNDEKFKKIIPGKYHPLLMFKDFYSRENLKIDNSFMTNADTPLLLINGIIKNPINPYTNKILKSQKENGISLSLSDKFSPLQNNNNYKFIYPNSEKVHVNNGNIFDSSNWTLEESND